MTDSKSETTDFTAWLEFLTAQQGLIVEVSEPEGNAGYSITFYRDDPDNAPNSATVGFDRDGKLDHLGVWP